jgi:glycosyltransferase involved in cell wall biosynthesis
MSNLAKTEGVWYSKAIPFLVQWTYPFADQVIAVSKGAADNLQEMSENLDEKVHVIYNPVVDESIDNKSQKKVDHDWVNDPSTPVIIGVGRMTPQKNFPLLISAFRKIRKDTGAKLVILGGGPEKPKLRKLIKKYKIGEHVSLPGYVSNPYAYLSRASLFALSSDFEGLPTVLIEALACGCPVVSTDCPSGPREILEDGRWGPLVPVGDAEALADAMVRTLTHPPERCRLKERSKAFKVANATRKYQEVLFPDNHNST